MPPVLLLASEYSDLPLAFAFWAGGISLLGAAVMAVLVAVIGPGAPAERPGFGRLYVAIWTFPLLHSLLVWLAWEAPEFLNLQGASPGPVALPVVMWVLLGSPMLLASLPTAFALARAWQRPAAGWLAIGATFGLSIAIAATAELLHTIRFSPVWAVGGPLMWLLVVGMGLKRLAPKTWSIRAEPSDNCPACGYSTAGLKQAVCPECGGSLSVQPAPGTSRTG